MWWLVGGSGDRHDSAFSKVQAPLWCSLPSLSSLGRWHDGAFFVGSHLGLVTPSASGF